MRLFTFVTASLATTSIVLAACTVEHTTSAPAADAGAPKADGAAKPLPLPGAGKDAGTSKPGTSKTCRTAALCLGDCNDGDDTCQDACLANLPDAELQELGDVATCIQNSGCADDDCIQQVCAAEIAACAN